MHYFNASDSRDHSDISTVHADRDCHHLDDAADVRGVHYVPEDAGRCGTCGDVEPEDDEEDEE